ncbi:nuclear transport factor 2 family protein [Congregibacter brevis]|uniref:Nuclear transport factor 2 family protein n=1 Tax=Congregibacter brevis TaxID=3081201 RepID=A0ABZ0ID81_9GAMM|nr:nuclear transport factor 2 family protein [Congregibacter sp. IMCC45268]
MRLRPTVLLAVTLISASASVGSIAESCTDQGVRDARTAFNVAIRDDDLDAMAGLFDEDIVLVTGTDSDLFVGRAQQLDLWRSEVGDADRLSYLREATHVEVSPLSAIALESGVWTGKATSGDEVGGEYSAKWRCQDARWMLEAELFMTTRCTGTMCD